MSDVFHLLVLYFAMGGLCAVMTRSDLQRVAYVLTVLAWPWFVWNDGTPKMRDFIERYKR